MRKEAVFFNDTRTIQDDSIIGASAIAGAMGSMFEFGSKLVPPTRGERQLAALESQTALQLAKNKLVLAASNKKLIITVVAVISILILLIFIIKNKKK
jgi:hypothetical protein